MKKKKKEPKFKVNPHNVAKSMKKQLGEFHAQRVVREIVNSNKNFSVADINTKDIFNLDEVKRNHRIWEQVYHILHK
jgi:hypothetical protein